MTVIPGPGAPRNPEFILSAISDLMRQKRQSPTLRDHGFRAGRRLPRNDRSER
jgi:hypothetical protein